MRDQIVEATKEAMELVTDVRFFSTERGYAGRFYCALMKRMDARGLLDDKRILEMEYQKHIRDHGTDQRPDIIYHIPWEVSGESRESNNYAVWALKLAAQPRHAREDFGKLDVMFLELNYPLGFFINIGASRHLLGEYGGGYPERIYGGWAYHDGTKVYKDLVALTDLFE